MAITGTIPSAFEITVSDKDTHFTTELVTNAIEEEDISFPADWVTAGIQAAEITNISVLSDQNLDWDIQFYATDGHGNTDADLDTFITTLNFATGDGERNAGAGLFKYDANPSFVPFYYRDQDNSSEWHITLINRDGSTKNAGATGEIVVKIHANPIL